MKSWFRTTFAVIGLALCCTDGHAAEKLKLLYLGDNGHHQPRARFGQLQPVLKVRGIELEYTDVVGDLNAERLAKFDGLVLFANIDKIEDEQAKALLDYVASGKGFVPLHCELLLPQQRRCRGADGRAVSAAWNRDVPCHSDRGCEVASVDERLQRL